MKKALLIIYLSIIYVLGYAQNLQYDFSVSKDSDSLIYTILLVDDVIYNNDRLVADSVIFGSKSTISLSFIDLSVNEIYSIIEEFPNSITNKVRSIEFVFLFYNTSFDVSYLTRFVNLEYVNFQPYSQYVSKNKLVLLQDIDSLSKLQKIKFLNISSSNFRFLSNLCPLKELKYLNLSFSDFIVEDSVFFCFPNLQHVIIGGENKEMITKSIIEITKNSEIKELSLILIHPNQIRLIKTIPSIEKLNLFLEFSLTEKRFEKIIRNLLVIKKMKSFHLEVESDKKQLKRIPELINQLENLEELSIDKSISTIDNLNIKNLQKLTFYTQNMPFFQEGCIEKYKAKHPNVNVTIEKKGFFLINYITGR